MSYINPFLSCSLELETLFFTPSHQYLLNNGIELLSSSVVEFSGLYPCVIIIAQVSALMQDYELMTFFDLDECLVSTLPLTWDKNIGKLVNIILRELTSTSKFGSI